MSFVDILRKLGILRFGTHSGTYRNAKEMPASALMEDVYDDKKDLLTGGEEDQKKNRRDGEQS